MAGKLLINTVLEQKKVAGIASASVCRGAQEHVLCLIETFFLRQGRIPLAFQKSCDWGM